MKPILKICLLIFQLISLPLFVCAALVLKIYRKLGSSRFAIFTLALRKIGVFPIMDHYYEPRFKFDSVNQEALDERNLPGIDLNTEKQLKLLDELNYGLEFIKFTDEQLQISGPQSFRVNNGSFESGDAEFLYSIVRYFKPKNIIEIGCGSSTKIIRYANQVNAATEGFVANHICIEPFEQPWLESFENVTVLRERLENVTDRIVTLLQEGDFLFIDSSHIIRPGGDVLEEFLNIIPSLPKGVIVHVHDIFTPRDYPINWLHDHVKFWNEQYLLEALLSDNDKFEIIAGLNYLKNSHYEKLNKVCPFLTIDREPGSFYFKVTR